MFTKEDVQKLTDQELYERYHFDILTNEELNLFTAEYFRRRKK